ncbi:MAG: NAD+ synthase [Rhodothermaceae bacterium]
MKIALGQVNPIIGDITGNKAKIIDRYRQGQKDNADLVIFPELALPGYPPQDLLEKREFRERVIDASKEIASQTNETALLFGSITEEDDAVGTGLYNSALLCYNGEIRFIQHKSLIPNYDVFDEVRYFEPAKDVFVHEFKGEKLGISICEDIWNDKDYWKNRRYNCDPTEILRDKGATIYLNLSASPYAYGRRAERHEMLSVLTKTDKTPLVYCCCTGAQTDLIFDGGSMCFNSKGELVQIGKTYNEDYFVFDTNKEQASLSSVEGSYEEEVHDALIYGLKDYANKTGFKKALIGLSGGIDSAIVTYFAVEAFGAENVDVVMMPSKYSSEGSVKDSEKLVEKLGIRSANISIQPVFDKVLDQLNPLFAGLAENVAEENIQSRIRGVYLMAISNKFGSLLCTTGNKSEMAVGYATLYGDMNGALGVIADVYKTKVYDLCRYINRNDEIIPVEIIEKAPSAELRPDQKDEDSLPPYDLLDNILKMYLEENKELNEISGIIKDKEVVEKILKLVDLNEFKRKQAAPVLRISKKAFGYGRRFPIVQGWKRK